MTILRNKDLKNEKEKKIAHQQKQETHILEYLKQLKSLVFPLIQHHQDANPIHLTKQKATNITSKYSRSLIFPISFFLPIFNRNMMLLHTEIARCNRRLFVFFLILLPFTEN